LKTLFLNKLNSLFYREEEGECPRQVSQPQSKGLGRKAL